MKKMQRVLLAFLAVSTGVCVLAGYFLAPLWPAVEIARQVILRCAALLAASALLVGGLNLLRVHLSRLKARQPGWPYSAALVLSLLSVLVVIGFRGPVSAASLWVFNYIHIPLEASLVILAGIILLSSGAGVIVRRLDLYSVVFFLSVLVALLGAVTLPGWSTIHLDTLRTWINQVFVTSGARGLVLGIALGVVVAGIRMLLAADRPYERPE